MHEGRGSADLSDADLVRAVLAGSREAFAVLYTRHAGAVGRAVSDNVHHPEARLDTVQESFTRALNRLETLREPERFRPWLLQIARNAAIDSRRATVATRTTSIDEEDAPELRCDDPGPEHVAEVRTLAEALRNGFAMLSPRDAAALSLSVHLGFGPAEVAAALDISYGNAKVVLHRARNRLRAALDQDQTVNGFGESGR